MLQILTIMAPGEYTLCSAPYSGEYIIFLTKDLEWWDAAHGISA